MEIMEAPKTWKKYKLGEVAEYINGRAFKPTEWETEGLPIIRIQNLKKPHAKYNYYSGDYEKKHEVNKGDILFAWSGTIGTSLGAFKWNREKAILNQHIFRVEVNEDILLPDFFLYLLNFSLDKINQEAHGGVGLGHITKANLVRIEVHIPPKDVQIKILQSLDEFKKEYEILLKEKQKAKDNYEQVFPSAINKLFFPEVIPKNWRKVKVRDVCELIQYGLTSKSVPEKEGLIYLRITDINSHGNLNKDFRYVVPTSDEKKKFLLDAGDIVIARTGATVGKSYLVKEDDVPMLFASYLIRFRPNKEVILPEFLYLQMNTLNYWLHINEEQVGIGQPNVNATKLGDFEVYCPESLDEQKAIIDQAKLIGDTTTVIRKEAENVDNQLKLLPHSVLTKAFKGELVS